MSTEHLLDYQKSETYQSNGMLATQMQNLSLAAQGAAAAAEKGKFGLPSPAVTYSLGPAGAIGVDAATQALFAAASPSLNPGAYAIPTPVAAVGDPSLMQAPPLSVKVEGLSFQYQFTEDDVRKVFSRYGDVVGVNVAIDGASATVIFAAFANAMAAWSDLNGKQLAGINGAFLKVDCPQLTQQGQALIGAPGWDPTFGYGVTGVEQFAEAGFAGQGKKYTCRLEIGIENEKEYRVGSKVIQVARKIWQELPAFQEHGGKTRLRGKGVGGPHESDEPLALCISCRDATCFEQAVQFAEQQITKIHAEYQRFCAERNYPAPKLKEVKAICDHPHTSAPWHQAKFDQHYAYAGSDKGSPSSNPAGKESRGKKPPNAPTDIEIERLIEERNEARKGGNFSRADEIREFLKSRGVVLMDDKGARGNKRGLQVTKWRYWNP